MFIYIKNKCSKLLIFWKKSYTQELGQEPRVTNPRVLLRGGFQARKSTYQLNFVSFGGRSSKPREQHPPCTKCLCGDLVTLLRFKLTPLLILPSPSHTEKTLFILLSKRTVGSYQTRSICQGLSLHKQKLQARNVLAEAIC